MSDNAGDEAENGPASDEEELIFPEEEASEQDPATDEVAE